MPYKHQIDTHVLPGTDDAVTIYKRADHSNPRWYYRIKLPDEPTTVPKSTKTNDFDKAKQGAIDAYYDLKARVQRGEPVRSKSFSYVADAFLKHQEYRNSIGDLSDGRLSYHNNVISRWFKAYFKNDPIDRITSDKISEYWKWRIGYWKSAEGKAELKARPHKVALNPKSTTLNEEKISLKQIFDYALEKQWMVRNNLPIIKAPVKVEVHSREAFTHAEWTKIHNHLAHEFLNGGRNANEKNSRRRQMAKFIAARYSGMRPPEINNLTWRDVRKFTSPQDGEDYAELYVHGKGKQRAITCSMMVYNVLMRWKENAPHTGDDDFVFALPDGKTARFDSQAFHKILIKLNLLRGKDGTNRTLYSLRHTYATQVIEDGDTDLLTLARNMGTSLKMIDLHYAHVVVRNQAQQLTASKRDERFREWQRDKFSSGRTKGDQSNAPNPDDQIYQKGSSS